MARFEIAPLVYLVRGDGHTYLSWDNDKLGAPIDEQALLNALFDSSHLDQSDTTAGLLKRFIEAKAKKTTLDALSKGVAKEIETLQEQVINHLADIGMQNTTIDGKMIYRSSTLYASMAEGQKDSLVAALREGDLSDMTTVNHSQFSALIRESLDLWCTDNGVKKEDVLDQIREDAFDWKQVFPTWGDKINVTEKITLGVRKATAK